MTHRRPITRRIRATALQPILTWTARRNGQIREIAAAMQLRCAACGVSLADHVGPRNRWKGCPTATLSEGAR